MLLLTKLTDETIEVLTPHNYTIKQPQDETYIVQPLVREGLIGNLYELTGAFTEGTLKVTTGDGYESTFEI